jgi:CBS domain-containing protein
MMPMTIKAHDCMTRSPVTIRSDEPALKAARLMVNHKISGLPVLDADGRVVGVVTDRDLLRSDERTGRRGLSFSSRRKPTGSLRSAIALSER